MINISMEVVEGTRVMVSRADRDFVELAISQDRDVVEGEGEDRREGVAIMLTVEEAVAVADALIHMADIEDSE